MIWLQWCTGSGKAALRFDGSDKTGTANGEMSYNVVWNNSGLTVKGNNQNITGNTLFDAADTGASKAPATYPSSQTGHSPLDFCGPQVGMVVENPGASTPTAQNRSIFAANLADRVSFWKACTNANCPFAGHWHESNVIGSSSGNASAAGMYPTKRFNIKTMLRDPWNHDFRACPGTTVAVKGAGAYPVWTPTDRVYWIPGAKRWAASQPSPMAGDVFARTDSELLFLGAFRATAHLILFDIDAGEMKELATLHGDANVVRPGALAPHTAYQWRVVAIMADGSTRAGPTWRFTTEACQSCSSCGGHELDTREPSPSQQLARPPHKPTPPSCRAALDACCGKGAVSKHGGDVQVGLVLTSLAS